MREIKFRAYFKTDKRIYNVLALGNNGVILWDDESEVDFECQFDDIELLEYTGLKDSNGVKIYEGDIVENLMKDPSGYEDFDGNWVQNIPDNDPSYFGKIFFKDASFYIRYNGGFETLLDRDCIVEVVGNIYENKELLDENH